MEKTLAQRIKEKYPGQYDDMADADLEASVLTKHPGVYDDLPRTSARPLSKMKSGISPEAVAPEPGPWGELKRLLLSHPFPGSGGEATGTENIPDQRGKQLFGPAAADRAMEEELASRSPGATLQAGLGTVIDDPAMRLKQAVAGLTPEEQQNVEFNRQIKGTPGGAVGNIAGNVAALAPAAGATAPAAIGRLASAFPRTAAVAGPAMGGAALVTATQPTLPGESETAQAATGALGGVAGKAAAVGLPVVVGGVKALLGKLAPEGVRITKEAVQALTNAMQRDGLDPVEVLNKANALSKATGRPVSLADVVGSDVAAVETQKVLQTALNEAPGGTRAPVSRALVERAKGQNERVTGDLAKGLSGSQAQKSEVFAELAKKRSEEAGPLYTAAFANKTPVVDERLTAMMDRPSMVEAFKKVLSKAKERGEPLDVTYTLDPASVPKALLTGEVKGGAHEMFAPSIQNLDTAKKKLYDLESELQRAGKNSDAQDIGNTRRELTSILDEKAPPEYQQARKMWGDYAEMEDQFKTGMDVFKKDPAEIQKAVDKGTPAEREAFVSGIISKVQEMSSKEGLDWAGNTLLRDVRKMAQLRAAFGGGPESEEKFQAFKSGLEAVSMTARSSKLYPPKGVTYAHSAGQTPGEIAATAVDVAHGGVGAVLMKALKTMTGVGLSKKGSGRLSELAYGAPGNISSNPLTGRLLQLPGQRGALPPETGVVGPLEMLRLKQAQEQP